MVSSAVARAVPSRVANRRMRVPSLGTASAADGVPDRTGHRVGQGVAPGARARAGCPAGASAAATCASGSAVKTRWRLTVDRTEKRALLSTARGCRNVLVRVRTGPVVLR